MRRKVIQIADSTQLISLPRKWAVKYGIRKGDELEVQEDGSKIVVLTEKYTEPKRCQVDLREQPKLKRRTICAAYLKGFDEIEILYSSPDYIQTIQSILPEFAGYDIVSQSKNSCVIRQISKPTAEEFENVFNRLFLLLSDTLKTMTEAIRSKDNESLQGVQFREHSINKFSNFCRRIVNRGGHSNTESSSNTYFVLINLEFLGDELKNLSKHLQENKKYDKKLSEILTKITTLYDVVYKIFKTKDRKKAAENALLYDELEAEIHAYFKSDKTDPIAYQHITRIMQIIIQIQEALLMFTL